jgi:ribonuclease HII
MVRGKRFDPTLLPPTPDLSLEEELWHSTGLHLAGIDEAGRGALAGPVAAAAVILPADLGVAALLNGVRDSKQMTARQRNSWAARIQDTALAWGVGLASCQEIDDLGIVSATVLAVQRAIAALSIPPDYLLLDGALSIAGSIPQTTLIKGDCRSLSIAAASVLAKTARDALLVDLHRDFPQYGFAAHKGYGTQFHLSALEQFGPTSHHRRSFAPLKIN